LKELAVYASKSAIAEDTNDIASLDVCAHMANDSLDVRQVISSLSFSLQLLHKSRRIKALCWIEKLEPGDLGNNHRIGIGKGRDQFALEDISPGSVGARLEDRPDFLLRVFNPQCAQGLANRGWMVSEIINHGNPAGYAADFHSSLDSFEGVKG
jgi:hypothetical protein